MDRVRIGLLLRRLRMGRGWDQAEMARRSGLGTQTVSRAERAERETKMETYEKLAGVFGLTADDLVRDAGEDEVGEGASSAIPRF